MTSSADQRYYNDRAERERMNGCIVLCLVTGALVASLVMVPVSAGVMAYLTTHHVYCVNTGQVTEYTIITSRGYTEQRFAHVVNVSTQSLTCVIDTGSAHLAPGFRCTHDKQQETCEDIESRIVGWRVASCLHRAGGNLGLRGLGVLGVLRRGSPDSTLSIPESTTSESYGDSEERTSCSHCLSKHKSRGVHSEGQVTKSKNYAPSPSQHKNRTIHKK